MALNLRGTKYNLIVVLGPTATGKTGFAALLASRLNGEIVSADSRQVYRRMDLGTGKDYADYRIEGKTIPYHLIDIHEPGYKYNVYQYQKDFLDAFTDIHRREKVPVLCGGTGMYIEAVTRGYRLLAVPVNHELRERLKDKTLPELEQILSAYKNLHNKTDTDTKKRAMRAIEIEEYYLQHPVQEYSYPVIRPAWLGMMCDRNLRRTRITDRLHARLESGMIQEVQDLLDEGLSAETLIYYGLEYKYITQYLTGEMEYGSMVEKLTIAIHQFAKRQMTWFRKMEREGSEIYWIDTTLPVEEKTELAIAYLNR
jgi:tRNA dimethylallyltransferase